MNRLVVVGALACAILVGCTSAKDGTPGAAGAKGNTGTQGPAGIQGLTGLTGAPGMVWRGAWNALDSYQKDDAVEHAGSAFVAVAMSSGLAPPSSDWQLLAASGAEGVAGPSGPAGATGPVGAQGAAGVSVATASLAPGHAVCTHGGTLVRSASGDSFVCNGASVVAVGLLPGADPACPAGGTRFVTGATTTFACNATEVGPCPIGRVLCGSACIDLTNDANNCGACANACNSRACFGATCAKTVFVSGATFDGNLGGVVGADAKCQAAASAAGVGGNFKAWVSDYLGSYPSKTFFRSPGPYVQVSGVLVARSWADIVSATASTGSSVINLDEYGRPSGTSPVWTGTTPGGFPSDPVYGTCWNWTSTSGAAAFGWTNSSNLAWTENSNRLCNTQARLYCFEQ